MSRVFPYPLLIVSLIVMWLLLTSFSLGQFIVGTAVALMAAQGMAALHPAKPRIRRWSLLPKLVAVVLYDIVRSNIAVAWLILREGNNRRVSGFMTIPLELRSPMGLAVLALILTATPGTAWLDYNSARGTLLLHVLRSCRRERLADADQDPLRAPLAGDIRMSSVILLWAVTVRAGGAGRSPWPWHYTGSCADRGRRIASLASIRCTSTPCSSFLSSASAPAARSISKPRW